MTYALNPYTRQDSPDTIRECSRIFGACRIARKERDQEAYDDLYGMLCRLADLGVSRAAAYVDTLELLARP